jgi:Holliday junction resolvasome RuvABC endonuclease subunit
LGSTAGWALQLTGDKIESGTISFRPSRYDGGGMRYLRFRAWLDSMAEDIAQPAAIYFEEVRRHAGTDAAHLYGGFLATLTAWCEQHSIAYQGVPVGTIKRFITGKGNADKQAVIDAVRARGFRPADDNEADAIAILLWAIETRGGVR